MGEWRARARELHAGGRTGFQRGARMAATARPGGSGGGARRRSGGTDKLRKQALEKEHAAQGLSGAALENQVRKNRVRWLKNYSPTKARSGRLNWAAEYLHVHEESRGIADRHPWQGAADCDCAAVDCGKHRSRKPFRGWNEGINTSASLSYLLGTSFRQLLKQRKRLDIIPVDAVCAGMTLMRGAGGAASRIRCISWRRR